MQLWDQRLDGRRGGGTDNAYGLAVDAAGNIALTGTGQKPNGSAFSEMITAKFNRFLLTKGDPITGPSLTPAAVISTYNVPALADSGALTAKVTVKDGTKSTAAILAQGNGRGNIAFARQGLAAPNASPALFKSFSDPVTAPDGSIAFSAKLSGVSGAFASGVWTDTFNGTLQGVLQLGKQVPGLDSGVLLKSVTGISLQDGYLVALIGVKGTNVNAKNAAVILGLTSATMGKELLRTGKDITVNGKLGHITKLTFYTPPKTSPGQGRYHGDGRIIANATLDDKRTVVIAVDKTGALSFLGATDGDAGLVTMNANWKSFGPPSVGGNGFHSAALATLQVEAGVVTAKQDTAIVYSLLGGGFDNIAIESGTAPGSNGGTFTVLNDPVSNDQGRYAFLATAKGGDFGTGKVGLWYGPSAGVNLLTRVGDFAPDALGVDTAVKFTALKNIALPNGKNAGPIFLATVAGTGVSGKNNLGLWGLDTEGYLRQLLRTGDQLGPQTVKSFVLLNALVGSTSVNRSFNEKGGVAALVSFTDKTQAIVYVGIP